MKAVAAAAAAAAGRDGQGPEGARERLGVDGRAWMAGAEKCTHDSPHARTERRVAPIGAAAAGCARGGL